MNKKLLFALATMFVGACLTLSAQTLTHSYNFNSDLSDGTGTANGTVHGAASVSGGNLVLGANGDYISFDGTQLGLNTYSATTLEFVIKSQNAFNGWNWAWYFGDSNAVNSVRGGFYTWSQIVGHGNTDGADAWYATTEDGNWHHIVYVFTGTTMSIYKDGTLLGTTTGGTSLTIGTAQNYIGKGNDGWGDPTWRGLVNEFNIYQGAMSAGAVSTRATSYLAVSSSKLTSLTSTIGTLAPAFNSTNTKYDLYVPAGTTSLSLTAIPFGNGANVTGNGAISGITLPQTANIVVTSEDLTTTTTYTVKITQECYTPTYSDRPNMIADPTFSSATLLEGGYGGWGVGAPGIDTKNPYCGNGSGYIRGTCWENGGSLNRSLNTANGNALQPNSTYRLIAMIKSSAPKGSFHFQIEGANGSGTNKFIQIENTAGNWVQLDSIFTTGNTVSQNGIYFNSCMDAEGKPISSLITDSCFIDNYELYNITDLTTSLTTPKDNLVNVFVRDNKIVVSLNVVNVENAEASIYSVNGILLSTQKLNLTSGITEKQLNANLPAGAYVVKVVTDGKSYTQKVIK